MKKPPRGLDQVLQENKKEKKKKGSRRKRWRTQLSVYEQIPDF